MLYIIKWVVTVVVFYEEEAYISDVDPENGPEEEAYISDVDPENLAEFLPASAFDKFADVRKRLIALSKPLADVINMQYFDLINYYVPGRPLVAQACNMLWYNQLSPLEKERFRANLPENGALKAMIKGMYSADCGPLDRFLSVPSRDEVINYNNGEGNSEGESDD